MLRKDVRSEQLFLFSRKAEREICSLGRILDIRFVHVRESLRKGILLRRVSHRNEILLFEVFCVTRSHSAEISNSNVIF